MLLISNEIDVLNKTQGQQWYVLLLKFKRTFDWLANEMVRQNFQFNILSALPLAGLGESIDNRHAVLSHVRCVPSCYWLISDHV
jgi:hypothetical protein